MSNLKAWAMALGSTIAVHTIFIICLSAPTQTDRIWHAYKDGEPVFWAFAEGREAQQFTFHPMTGGWPVAMGDTLYIRNTKGRP